MKTETFAVRGNIYYSTSRNYIEAIERGCIIVDAGKIIGTFAELPPKFAGIEVMDFGENLIIPGMIDLHVHAPQYPFRGLGMDLELLDWLNAYTFPEEAKYHDKHYAEHVYSSFADDLKASPTTRAVIFGTIHLPATKILMDKMEASGLISYVGKVNMNRNVPAELMETTETSIIETEQLINEAADYKRTRPILTPRFSPSCSDQLLAKLGRLKQKYSLPVQSHLSENPSEVELVRELCPESKNYADTYDRAGLLDSDSVMAHCVYLTDEEFDLLRKKETFIAHCPQSNINLASGIAPAKIAISSGINIGLGTDLAAGASLSMFRAITDAIGASKLRWRLLDEETKPLTFTEAFYMATMGGGKFFGKVGSFLPGYEADILVISEKYAAFQRKNLLERLEQSVYLSGENMTLKAKFVAGKLI